MCPGQIRKSVSFHNFETYLFYEEYIYLIIRFMQYPGSFFFNFFYPAFRVFTFICFVSITVNVQGIIV